MSDMFALTAIENVGKYLARAVKDGNDLEAREHVAFANTLSSHVMELSACSSEHSIREIPFRTLQTVYARRNRICVAWNLQPITANQSGSVKRDGLSI
jgi:alcohol dehydrogenase class IV